LAGLEPAIPANEGPQTHALDGQPLESASKEYREYWFTDVTGRIIG
jgi:hypothetical protein